MRISGQGIGLACHVEETTLLAALLVTSVKNRGVLVRVVACRKHSSGILRCDPTTGSALNAIAVILRIVLSATGATDRSLKTQH